MAPKDRCRFCNLLDDAKNLIDACECYKKKDTGRCHKECLEVRQKDSCRQLQRRPFTFPSFSRRPGHTRCDVRARSALAACLSNPPCRRLLPLARQRRRLALHPFFPATVRPPHSFCNLSTLLVSAGLHVQVGAPVPLQPRARHRQHRLPLPGVRQAVPSPPRHPGALRKPTPHAAVLRVACLCTLQPSQRRLRGFWRVFSGDHKVLLEQREHPRACALLSRSRLRKCCKRRASSWRPAEICIAASASHRRTPRAFSS